MALNQTIVTFDPYVSILDKENRYRYKIPDLIPLVCLAATKFKRFFIPLSAKDLNLGKTINLFKLNVNAPKFKIAYINLIFRPQNWHVIVSIGCCT